MNLAYTFVVWIVVGKKLILEDSYLVDSYCIHIHFRKCCFQMIESYGKSKLLVSERCIVVSRRVCHLEVWWVRYSWRLVVSGRRVCSVWLECRYSCLFFYRLCLVRNRFFNCSMLERRNLRLQGLGRSFCWSCHQNLYNRLRFYWALK